MSIGRRGGREKGDVRSDCDKKRNKTMRWKGPPRICMY